MAIVARRVTLGLVLLLGLVAFAQAANIDSSQKFIWGENVGWINFENVTVSSSALSGYAWGENVGWISLDCSNTSSCGSVSYGVLNNGSGALSGYAWGENTGWISFSCATTNSCSTVDYGVSINASTGQFSGYAWGENIGWLVFSCATTNSCGTVDYRLITSWRQSASTASSNSGGGANPAFLLQPEGIGRVAINNGAPTTISTAVALSLTAGANVKRMAVSNYSDFRDSVQELYQPMKSWGLLPVVATETPILQTAGLTRTVYVRYFTDQGQPSPLLTASIRLVAEARGGILVRPTLPELKPISILPIGPIAPVGRQSPTLIPPPISSLLPTIPLATLQPRLTPPPETVAPERLTFKPPNSAPLQPKPAPATRPSRRSLFFFNLIGLIALILLVALIH